MEHLIEYFETIPSLHRGLILVGGLTFFWFLEGTLPLFKFGYNKWKHALPNLFFTFTTILINFALAFLLLNTSDWVVLNDFGILNWLPEMPFWLYVVVGVFLEKQAYSLYIIFDNHYGSSRKNFYNMLL